MAEALQYVSYYHPPDFIQAMARTLDAEESPSARNAIRQIEAVTLSVAREFVQRGI